MGQRGTLDRNGVDVAVAEPVLGRRRMLFATAVLVTYALALLAMTRLLGADGFGLADLVLLACFAAMLPWNVIGFWNAIVGFALLTFVRDPVARVFPGSVVGSAAASRMRLAIVMPVHNEDPARVIRHLEQTVASLAGTGFPLDFEVFLLSDTQLPGAAAPARGAVEAGGARYARRGRRD